MANSITAAVLGASGYTGAETIRLLAGHPNVHLGPISANAQAGRTLGNLYPHLQPFADKVLVKAEDIDFSGVDVAFGCLPHGASEEVLKQLPSHVRIIDLSADYRFRDADVYARHYGRDHSEPNRTKNAIYGLSEFAREKISASTDEVIACPGCYPTATLLALLMGMKSGMIAPDDIIIDAKSGVSGAGRSLKEANLFCETAEGVHAYGVGAHRHAPEIDQELSLASGVATIVNFTPHLIPMTRGELVTCHVKLANGASAEDLRAAMASYYKDEPFVRVAEKGVSPDTRWVRGSNLAVLAVFEDRVPGRAIIVGVIDNLVKGSGGQAVQNMNIAFGFSETAGLTLQPLFP